VLDRFDEVVESLADHPQRGNCPKELVALGMRDYRQVFFKPYRVIYRVVGQRVYIYVVADGRRDMQTLLAMRLFAD
jgi:toxin ParE1/3/4